MKSKYFITLLCFLNFGVLAQTNSGINVIFCNQIGQGKAATITLSKEELRKCDWTILPTDTNSSVVSFKLILITENNKSKKTEIELKGNVIPMNYRDQILSETNKFLIEYIKAKMPDNSIRSLKAITVNIQ